MKGIYLINLIERYCKETNSNISQVYEKLGNAYQDYYGTNIVMEMRQNGQHDIIQYLENKGEGFIDRYVTLFNHNIK